MESFYKDGENISEAAKRKGLDVFDTAIPKGILNSFSKYRNDLEVL